MLPNKRVLFAPAFFNFSGEPLSIALDTINKSLFNSRAVKTTYTLSAYFKKAEVKPLACFILAFSRTSY